MQSQDSRYRPIRCIGPENPTRLVRTNVAARITGLAARTIRHLAHHGVIPAIRKGKRCWYFKVADLLRFNARRAVAHGVDFGEFKKNPLRVPVHAQGQTTGGLSPSSGGAL